MEAGGCRHRRHLATLIENHRSLNMLYGKNCGKQQVILYSFFSIAGVGPLRLRSLAALTEEREGAFERREERKS